MIITLAERSRLLEMSVVLDGVGRHEDAALLVQIASRNSVASAVRETPPLSAIHADMSYAVERLADKDLMAFAKAAGWRVEQLTSDGQERRQGYRWLSPQGRTFTVATAGDDCPSVANDELRAAMRESLVPQG